MAPNHSKQLPAKRTTSTPKSGKGGQVKPFCKNGTSNQRFHNKKERIRYITYEKDIQPYLKVFKESYGDGQGRLVDRPWEKDKEHSFHDYVVGRVGKVKEKLEKESQIEKSQEAEKLSKRYRNDLNRAANRPGPVSSSWVHFNSMHAMERGSGSGARVNSANSAYSSPGMHEEVEEDEDDEELYQSIRQGVPSNKYRAKPGFVKFFGFSGGGSVSTRVVGNGYEKFGNHEGNPGFWGATRVVGNGYKEKVDPSLRGCATSTARVGVGGNGSGSSEKLGKRKERPDVGEIVGAIKALGEGFVRVERMKMDMAREVEAMRMDMEMKRTKMIVEFQQKMVEAFANACADDEDKKIKRSPEP